MYFASRIQAGRMLANRLYEKYRYENCVVLAISDGGVIVGSQIAVKLHCLINYLVSDEIILPKENQAFAGITSDGKISYNNAYSQGQIDEFKARLFQV
jgi:predicted phosphoribosyltransferase